MSGRLKRTYRNHSEAFKETYGLNSKLGPLTDMLISVVGLAAWLLVAGPLKWIGLLVAVGSTIGLGVRLYRAVTA